MNSSGGVPNHIDPIGFNFTSSTSTSSSRAHADRGLTRPRMVKLRKHTSNPAPNSKPFWFNTFTTAGEVLIEELKRLNVGDQQNETHRIEDDLRKLDIKSGNIRENPIFEFPNAGNVDTELQRKLSSKMERLDLEGGVDTGCRFRDTHEEEALHIEVERKLNLGHEDVNLSPSGDQENDPVGITAGHPFVFPSSANVQGDLPNDKLENMGTFVFTTRQHTTPTSFRRFAAPIQKVGHYSPLEQNVDGIFQTSKTIFKTKNANNMPTGGHLWSQQPFVPTESSVPPMPEANEECSPMEISPCRETVDESLFSRESSVTSQESITHGNYIPPGNSQGIDLDEDRSGAVQSLKTNVGGPKFTESDNEVSCNGSCELLVDESISGVETESFKSANEELDFISDCSTLGEHENSNPVGRDDSGMSTQFYSCRSSGDCSGSNFTFSATSPLQGSLLRSKKKKNNSRVIWEPSMPIPVAKTSYPSATVTYAPSKGVPLPSSPSTIMDGTFVPHGLVRDNFDLNSRQEYDDDKCLHVSASIEAHESCDKWRLRGNLAYNGGELLKAEECYIEGINCISKRETSRSCLRALVLCYSNLAATHMSLGRVRAALQDCQLAVSIDPTFFRVQLRAANCCLALGEVEDAIGFFRTCLQSESDICVDRKIYVEASNGLHKTQKVSEHIQQCERLLKSKDIRDLETALATISEALLISPFSEKLLKAKAECLFLLQKYEEVISLSQQSFDSAEKNAVQNDYSYRFWRFRLTFLCHFYIGRLEDAINLLEKQENSSPVIKCVSSNRSEIEESLNSLAVTVQELLRYKVDGNKAFKTGKLSEAIELYTAALSRNIDSRHFAAVCFCNRAAAYKSLGQIVDAIADCNLAIALDGSYAKALSRRATLYEMIRDYNQAARDLRRVIATASKFANEKTSNENLESYLRRDRSHLSFLEEEGRKEIPLDFYLILGVETSASSSEIKKAYHKAALRHHPDKAGQSLPRGDMVDEGVWKEIGEEVHKTADKLFKMIGESYAVLSNQLKRSHYDLEEEARNAQKQRSGSSSVRAHANAFHYPFDRTDGGRHWRESWRS